VATSDEEVRLAETGLEQAQDGYRLGVLTQLDVFNAEMALKLARIRRANYLLERSLARFSLRKSAGLRAE
jgi:outer membrane protein TolC